MKERIKSLVLASLVAASLVQSYFLIYRLPGGGDSVVTSETNYVKTENMGQERNIEELIFPDQMIIHLGGDKHTVFYPGNTFYQLIYSRIQGRTFEDFQRRNVQSVNWEKIRKENQGFELSFKEGIPVQLLQRVMRLGTDSLFQGETINRISIYTAKNDSKVHALFFSAKGDVVYEAAQADLTVQDVQQHVDFGSNWTPYTLMEGGYYIPRAALETIEAEVPTGQFTVEQMQRSLFFDPSMTRNIREKDGSEIYTDSKRSLQIKQEQRWMTYTDPAAPPAGQSDPAKDALSAVDFVNQHGGWKGRSRMMIESSDNRTSLQFQQYYGSFPILDLAQFRFGTISMEMQQETVSSYERSLEYLNEGSETKKAVKLSGGDKLKALIEKVTGSTRQVEDVYPAYRPSATEDGLKLIPVWVIRFTNGEETTVS
ncbi:MULTISPECIES: YycH family regulatory protein [Paenibacillus]|uniref:YycH family regulatory protein n=1 Tax=Paenibacillus TaxID=44249 RepID=UPI001F2965B9|nr:two-component system activity regulator YycH [Paenibacillus sp. JJ-223]CAH1197320.1 Two-component system WalR/WalK regulatory protein YycH [Paenibacillus sp. JJ-223]